MEKIECETITLEMEKTTDEKGRITRAKTRARTLSTIINSLHDLSSKTSDFQSVSPLRLLESDNELESKSALTMLINIKEEPVSDYSSDELTMDENGSKRPDVTSQDCVGVARDTRRKRGRPKKDSLVKIPPLEAGQKRKQVRYKDHPCEVCGKLFDSYYLKIHMRRHTGEKPFGCGKCGRAFCKKSGLKMHLLRHHGDLDEPQCDSDSQRVQGDPPNSPKFKCGLCGKEFRRQAHLGEHEKAHRRERQFKCEVCGGDFKAKVSLEKHKETVHDGIKRVFPCHLCDKSFTRKAKLNDHVNFHLGQSRHLCEYCGKPFLSRKTLRTHLLIHEDKKPYLCQVCGRSFRQSNVLKLHMTTHTGIKPYKCELCCKQFIHRVYMVRHQCPNKPVMQQGEMGPEVTNGPTSE